MPGLNPHHSLGYCALCESAGLLVAILISIVSCRTHVLELVGPLYTPRNMLPIVDLTKKLERAQRNVHYV